MEYRFTSPTHYFMDDDYTLTLVVNKDEGIVTGTVTHGNTMAVGEFTFGDVHFIAHAADNAKEVLTMTWPDEQNVPPHGCENIHLTITPSRKYANGSVTFGFKGRGGVTVDSGRLALVDDGEDLAALMSDGIPTFMKVQVDGVRFEQER